MPMSMSMPMPLPTASLFECCLVYIYRMGVIISNRKRDGQMDGHALLYPPEKNSTAQFHVNSEQDWIRNKQGRIHEYPSRVLVVKSSAGEAH